MAVRDENIFLFIPNLIGYGRIFLAIISFYFMPTNYAIAGTCYILSGLLDSFDGHAARYYNQSTKFGAMLDQLTDRCSTMCLCVTLSNFYPQYMLFFQMSMVIDVACHWIFLHSCLLKGKASHKYHDLNDNPIMAIYYTKTVLFMFCACNELFYASLYLLHFMEGPTFINVGLFRIIVYVTAPVSFIKTLISLVHGYVASVNIAAVDIAERQDIKVN